MPSEIEGGMTELVSTYICRGEDIVVVRGVVSPPLDSLKPSSESMTVSLSKAGLFLNPGVVRSAEKLIHRTPNVNESTHFQ